MRKSIITGLVLSSLTMGMLQAQVADSARRLLKLQGAVNFRDVGGYATAEGKQVKWGQVYRAAALNNLTGADLDSLKKRKIDHVVDFRGNAEAAKDPDNLAENTLYLLLPAGSGDGDLKKVFSQIKNGEEAMKYFYANTDALVPRYKPFFQQLLSLSDSSALVYHCTAGKDRTGIATALFLYSLGVPRETILEDYLATNVYRKDANEEQIAKMEQMGLSQEVAKDLLGVKASYLQSMFDAVDKEYGSLDQFLKKGLGLDDAAIRQLKQRYTE